MYLSHVYLYLSSRHCFLCMLSDSDLSIYMYLLLFGFTVVPLISFMLLVIACTCMPEPHHLIMYTCDCLICTPLGFIICTRGLHLITLYSHVQILESGPWWPCYSWSECAADPSIVIGAQQKLGYRRSSSSQLFSWLAPKAPLAARELLSAFVMYISL